ncbi:hypothetical protein Leryth_008236 [Lithospermum erythrorhizon]|uniref:Chromatin/chromatin-binding, or -regulatory protein n=1 Tax=Lithospermum erythrorhizon TaxID=34254 RepID=A0AAV3PXY1_LITER|nr:hypothetical protein Leryth_008236 [Lithospermum erythrorhizon]
MASEAELTKRLQEILDTSDLNTTTTTTVRRKLEEHFGIDLSDKKVFIREQIDLFLQTQNQNDAHEAQEQEDVEQEEEEEEVVSRPRKCKMVSKKRLKKEGNEVKKRGGGGGGFTKPCALSPQLQKFAGVPELARTEVVKKLWSYIREHDLQDPANRRNIVCDDTLREIFDVDTINMFQMNKALTKHIWPLDSTCVRKYLTDTVSYNQAVASNSAAKEKQHKQDEEEDSEESNRKEKCQKSANSDSEESNRKEKRQKSANSGIHAPIPLSDPLMKFFGTGETALPRSDVIKKMWGYIKQNSLQDPSDKRRILCDEKLQELFNVDQFNGFSMAKLLKDHFIKKE